jgi:hypothetical protein
MNNQPIAYTGFFLVILSFLGFVGLMTFGNTVAWVRGNGEQIGWGAFVVCIAGWILGLINWKTAPGKVAACFGGLLIATCLLHLMSATHPQPPSSPVHIHR